MPPPQQITQTSILRVLIIGFTLVIVVLLAAAFFVVRNTESIKEHTASLVREQLVASRLLTESQRQEVALTEVFDKLAGDPDSIDPDQILSQLDETDRNIDRILRAASQSPDQPLWRGLKEASAAFAIEARRVLDSEEEGPLATRDLFRRHEQVKSITAKLVGASYTKVIAAQGQIVRRSQKLVRESAIFLGACFLLALVCTVLTVRMTAQLFRKMEWQTGELSRVSWHMLENQETTARRFSHELHDELGQSLTAVKTNLVALRDERGWDRIRLEDCVRLVEEAIGNVRQLSQLLRPTILDDFGLDAGLRWLCEGFTHRTRIEVEFTSNLTGRLPDETETHLFRLAQEALTNIARHSGATRVRVDLRSQPDETWLSISDNGHGLGAASEDRSEGADRPEGLGMIGMRARARSVGGDLSIRNREGGGVLIEVRVPTKGAHVERKDTHLVS